MQTFQQPLSQKEEAYYLKLSKEGDLQARNLLVERNLRLVAHIVKKYRNSSHEHEDLIQAGTIGLIKAINTFNASKGNKLGTYASRCIENELLMLFRQEKKTGKDVSLYEPIGSDKEGNEIHLMDIMDTDSEDIVNRLILESNIDSIYTAINSLLTPREKQIIKQRYGLYGLTPMTQREIASTMNISRSYVSRIEKRALQKLFLFIENK